MAARPATAYPSASTRGHSGQAYWPGARCFLIDGSAGPVGRGRGLGRVVAQAQLEELEGVGGAFAHLGGQPGEVAAAEDPHSDVVYQCALCADQRVRRDLRSQVTGGRAGVGGQDAGEHAPGLTEHLLLTGLQGRAVGDQLADGAEPGQRLDVTLLYLGEQAVLADQGTAERGDR